MLIYRAWFVLMGCIALSVFLLNVLVLYAFGLTCCYVFVNVFSVYNCVYIACVSYSLVCLLLAVSVLFVLCCFVFC